MLLHDLHTAQGLALPQNNDIYLGLVWGTLDIYASVEIL